jgi:hypothetical protein
VSGSAGQPGVNGLLLDDFEDQNNSAEPDGWWYAIDDGTGPSSTVTFEPVRGRGVSRFGAHLAAGPTTGFGAFLGLDLAGPIFDATGFSALSFFARMEPAGELSVRFQTPRGTQFVQSRDVDGTWQELRLPLADFVSSEGTPLDPAQPSHLQLWVAGERPALDLYVDDFWLLSEP